MKITEVHKKLKIIKSLTSEFGTVDTIIKAIEKAKIKDLPTDETFLTNIKRRREQIIQAFDKYLK